MEQERAHEERNNAAHTPVVSIVIVCMNNLGNLRPCLDSIRRHTAVEYETLVVAYLFSKEHLARLRQEYPWVTVIESNEIRGFSENNNLALRQAKGEYCLVLNDDTEMTMPVVDRLVESFDRCPANTAIVSPVLLNAEGKVSVCGREKTGWREWMLREWGCNHFRRPSKYVNKEGLFQTYNIIGAAFLIRTAVFRKIGWFDERYFFCPEDIAVSTTLNKQGYACYVNAAVPIYHYEGMSSKSLSLLQTAIKPAVTMGLLICYSEGRWYIKCLMKLILFFSIPSHFLYHYVKGCRQAPPNADQILAIGDRNRFISLLMGKSPKETFMYFYTKLKDERK